MTGTPEAARPSSRFERIAAATASIREWRLARAFARYSQARGGLLAGGIAYSGIFALAAALTLSWTVFMVVLGRRSDLRHGVLEAIDGAMPGIVTVGDNQGIIDPDSLVLSSAITPGSAIAALVLLWTAMSVMTALATSLRAMFGIVKLGGRPLVQYLRSFGGFIVLALGVGSTGVLTAILGSLGESALESVGIFGGTNTALIRACGHMLAFLIDACVVAFLVRVMAGVRVITRDLVVGCAIAALGTSLLRVLGTTAVKSVAHNPLLASFAALVTLLLWINLAARLILICAAFMANPPAPEARGDAQDVRAKDTPNYVTKSAPETLEWAYNSVIGSIDPTPEVAQVREELPQWRGISGWRAKRRMDRAHRRAIRAVADSIRAQDKYEAGARRTAGLE